MLSTDHKTAIESGADALLPKPMSRTHLLQLALQSVSSASAAELPARDKNSVLPLMAAVDDSPFALAAWELKVKDAKVHTFNNPEDFLDYIDKYPGFLSNLECIAVDYHYDNSVENCVTFGKLLKSQCRSLPVLLSSDGEFDDSELSGAIDLKIGKRPVCFEEIRGILSAR